MCGGEGGGRIEIQCETLITLKMFQYLEFTPDLICKIIDQRISFYSQNTNMLPRKPRLVIVI